MYRSICFASRALLPTLRPPPRVQSLWAARSQKGRGGGGGGGVGYSEMVDSKAAAMPSEMLGINESSGFELESAACLA